MNEIFDNELVKTQNYLKLFGIQSSIIKAFPDLNKKVLRKDVSTINLINCNLLKLFKHNLYNINSKYIYDSQIMSYYVKPTGIITLERTLNIQLSEEELKLTFKKLKDIVSKFFKTVMALY